MNERWASDVALDLVRLSFFLVILLRSGRKLIIFLSSHLSPEHPSPVREPPSPAKLQSSLQPHFYPRSLHPSRSRSPFSPCPRIRSGASGARSKTPPHVLSTAPFVPTSRRRAGNRSAPTPLLRPAAYLWYEAGGDGRSTRGICSKLELGGLSVAEVQRGISVRGKRAAGLWEGESIPLFSFFPQLCALQFLTHSFNLHPQQCLLVLYCCRGISVSLPLSSFRLLEVKRAPDLFDAFASPTFVQIIREPTGRITNSNASELVLGTFVVLLDPTRT